MKRLLTALALLSSLLTLAATAPALADVTCYPQASGVVGVIANQKDVIASVNCLGQQLAELRRSTSENDRNLSARIDVLAQQIGALAQQTAALQAALNELSERDARVERLLSNMLSSPTTSPPR